MLRCEFPLLMDQLLDIIILIEVRKLIILGIISYFFFPGEHKMPISATKTITGPLWIDYFISSK